MDSSCSKAPNFLKADFKDNIRDEGGRCVITGWWSSFNCGIFWNLDHLVSSHLEASACGQCVVTILHWLGGLSLHRTAHDKHQSVIRGPSRGASRPGSVVLIMSCSSLLFRAQGGPNKKQGHQWACIQETPKVLLVSPRPSLLCSAHRNTAPYPNNSAELQLIVALTESTAGVRDKEIPHPVCSPGCSLHPGASWGGTAAHLGKLVFAQGPSEGRTGL